MTLFRRAKQLNSSSPEALDRYRNALATIYVAAIMSNLHGGDVRWRVNSIVMTRPAAARLRMELERVRDPAILSDTGKLLVESGQEAEIAAGLDLLQKAIRLDPANTNWSEALEWAKAEPIRRQNERNILHLVAR